MDKNSKIYVAGHGGMVGTALTNHLNKYGYNNLVTASKEEVDLMNAGEVDSFFKRTQPEYVFLVAAKVGGIQANISYPAEFLYNNVMIQTNVIHHAYVHKARKILVLGSSCIYPKSCPQPMKEEYLLTGKLEPTNEGYALTKILALKQAEFYHKQYGFNAISIMPPNLYGPNDSFDLQHSHVLSALVRKFSDAKRENIPEVTLWGSGTSRREFMHVNDMAECLTFYMQNYDSPEFMNVGWGIDISIKELAALIASKVGFSGETKWDVSKPDGMPRKCMDNSKMKGLGYMPKITLEEGIEDMITEYEKVRKIAQGRNQ